MAVTSAAVRTVTASVHRHWFLGPIGSNVNQCSIAPRSSTAYRNGEQRQRSYLTSHCPTLELWVRTSELVDSVLAVVLHRHRPLGHVRRWQHPSVYRPLVDLPTMEARHVPFLQEDGPDGGVVAAVEPVDSEDEEAEEEDMDNRDSVIQQYFQ
ncbi:hypothetical protein NDU88_003826 [Pleurodeles waltl]|uniref:Uncharacterized protein n=1 Tax=Pleurodeles waltl TaxID=8319 RepID=A0AAV7W822_PLEWA|nr:hypothetical protein NDU88_003826 [Pleurodeles waltl]